MPNKGSDTALGEDALGNLVAPPPACATTPSPSPRKRGGLKKKKNKAGKKKQGGQGRGGGDGDSERVVGVALVSMQGLVAGPSPVDGWCVALL